MDDKKEKPGLWQSWMTITVLSALVIMVIWSNIHTPATRPEENVSMGNITHVPTDNNVNTEENGINTQVENNTGVPVDNNTIFKTWMALSFKEINQNLECISKESTFKNFAGIERCGRLLANSSNFSMRHVDQYNISSSLQNVSDEYIKALEDYNIGGMRLEIGARNQNLSQMGDALDYIQNGTAHIQLVDSMSNNDSMSSNNSISNNSSGTKFVHPQKGVNTSGY